MCISSKSSKKIFQSKKYFLAFPYSNLLYQNNTHIATNTKKCISNCGFQLADLEAKIYVGHVSGTYLLMDVKEKWFCNTNQECYHKPISFLNSY